MPIAELTVDKYPIVRGLMTIKDGVDKMLLPLFGEMPEYQIRSIVELQEEDAYRVIVDVKDECGPSKR